MKLTSACFGDEQKIPVECAFCAPDARTRVTLSTNLNPDLSWSDLPSGTRSLVLVCHDRDVPSKADDVNQDDFFHWVLMDIPAEARSLAEGEGSQGIQPRGKSGPDAGHGRRHGSNDYTLWFKGDAAMEGTYFGYDGPCPPFNDTVIHPYTFTLYALDVARCPVEGVVDGRAVRQAIEGHVLASATLIGTYTLAADARAR